MICTTNTKYQLFYRSASSYIYSAVLAEALLVVCFRKPEAYKSASSACSSSSCCSLPASRSTASSTPTEAAAGGGTERWLPSYLRMRAAPLAAPLTPATPYSCCCCGGGASVDSVAATRFCNCLSGEFPALRRLEGAGLNVTAISSSLSPALWSSWSEVVGRRCAMKVSLPSSVWMPRRAMSLPPPAVLLGAARCVISLHTACQDTYITAAVSTYHYQRDTVYCTVYMTDRTCRQSAITQSAKKNMASEARSLLMGSS